MPMPQGRGPLTVTEIQADSPAEGTLQVGDKIVSADGRTFPASADLTAYVRSRAGHEVVLGHRAWRRSPVEVAVVPRELTEQDIAQGKGAIGFSYEPERFAEVPSSVSGPVDALVKGFYRGRLPGHPYPRRVWPRRSEDCWA